MRVTAVRAPGARRHVRPGPPPLVLIYSVTVTGILNNTLIGPAIPDILAAFDQPDSRAGVLVASGALPGIVYEYQLDVIENSMQVLLHRTTLYWPFAVQLPVIRN